VATRFARKTSLACKVPVVSFAPKGFDGVQGAKSHRRIECVLADASAFATKTRTASVMVCYTCILCCVILHTLTVPTINTLRGSHTNGRDGRSNGRSGRQCDPSFSRRVNE